MSSAMPVEARKKPNSTATTAGPALSDPPRINTTKMIANSSTTDSEMATTDHTFGRPLVGPGRAARHTPTWTILPPTGPGYTPRDEWLWFRFRQPQVRQEYFGRGAPVTGW